MKFWLIIMQQSNALKSPSKQVFKKIMDKNIKKEKAKLIPVILAGGVGSRLWPLSREAHPKPFIRLSDGLSLIQKTLLRAAAIDRVSEVITVTNRELFFYTKDDYELLGLGEVSHTFLLEPFGRNSSAAIALAAHYAKEEYGEDSVLLILPADHLIDKQSAFTEEVQQAAILAEQGRLVTFGIKPDSPKTGYGYIEADQSNTHKVKRFVEKPDLELAKQYLAAGNYFWNSGMFCMTAGAILEEMNQLCTDIATETQVCLETASRYESDSWLQLEIKPNAFEAVRDISIDYAVFEKSEKVAVVPCDIGWSDIGSWIEFGELHAKDQANNHVYGEAVLEDVQNSIVHATGDRLVTGLGLQDLIIADTQDALLVAHRDRAQDVRKIVKTLQSKQHPSYKSFPTIHRPWGTYTVLQEDQAFKLKRIEVKPGGGLSLQSHKHRSEHWVVVSGIARITNGDQIFHLESNQSTYIPAGNKHRLENKGKEVLVVIEVQCGSYLGEDDIVRYEDMYGR